MNEPKRGGLDMLLASRPPVPSAKPTQEIEEREEHARFFGFMHGIQERALNVEFRPSNGPWLLIEYSYFVSAEWHHAGEFALIFATGHRITVKGRRLREMYDRFRRHRVTYVRAMEDGEKALESELFVDEITVEARVDAS